MWTWEEELTSDVVSLRDSNGTLCGRIEPVGGSWAGYLDGSLTPNFLRPDKTSAQVALVKLVKAQPAV